MSGSWKDTADGAIDWTDFDEQTIECVLHYLYTGDYHIPSSEAGALAPVTECVENLLEQNEGASN